MKSIKYIVSLSLCSLALAAFAEAEDPVIENTAEAQRLMAEAAKDYNRAVADIQNSDAILRDNIGRASNMSRVFSARQTAYEEIARKLEAAKDKMRLLQENYRQGKTAVEFASGNLNFANAAFPIGEKRFEFADSLYKQGLEIVSKNPGKNYEDKNYFDGVWSLYMRERTSFKASQKEAAKLLLTLSIANPRMEGIEAAIKLAQDFLDKTSNSVGESKLLTEDMRKSVQELYDGSLKAYGELTAQMGKLADARSEFTKANFALSAFVMNELPKNPKYYNTIFKADMHYLNSLRYVVAKAKGMGGENLSSFRTYDEKRGSKLDEVDMAWQRPAASYAAQAASANSRSSNVLNLPSTPDTVREEILNITLKITNLAAEIAQANAFLTDIISESQTSLRAVETSEADANTLLRSALGFFTEAQSNASELQIFKNSMGVTLSQSKVSSNEFKKLCENADNLIKACSDNTSEGLKKLEAAKAALK